MHELLPGLKATLPRLCLPKHQFICLEKTRRARNGTGRNTAVEVILDDGGSGLGGTI